jgi:hypothetical protein
MMAEPTPETPDPLDVILEQAVAICDGDVCAALRAALVANSFLTAEVERLTADVERLTQAVSFGFLRKRLPARRASEKLDEWRDMRYRGVSTTPHSGARQCGSPT